VEESGVPRPVIQSLPEVERPVPTEKRPSAAAQPVSS
jgi:hypothetical protein